MSLGADYSLAFNQAVTAIVDAGVTVVVAAGNDGVDASNASPASAPGVIAVGAVDVNDNRAWFSNFGNSVPVYAPGVDVKSSWKCKGCYEVVSGTSMGESSPPV